MSRYVRVLERGDSAPPQPGPAQARGWLEAGSSSEPTWHQRKYGRALEQIDEAAAQPIEPEVESGGLSQRPAAALLPRGGAWRAELERLRGAVVTAKQLHGVRVLVMSGARADDGSAALAVYLALILAEMNRGPVALADVSPREPGVRQLIGDELLNRQLKEVLPFGGNLHIQPTGIGNFRLVATSRDRPSLMTLLQSSDVLRRVSERFSFVILSAPPVLMHPDTALLAAKADGVILVAQPDNTRLSDLEAAQTEFQRVDARILGVALSQCREYLPKLLTGLV